MLTNGYPWVSPKARPDLRMPLVLVASIVNSLCVAITCQLGRMDSSLREIGHGFGDHAVTVGHRLGKIGNKMVNFGRDRARGPSVFRSQTNELTT